MNNKKIKKPCLHVKVLYLLICLSISFSALGQTTKATITGKVTDKFGQPLPGMNIIEKSTSNGTITDFDGNYNITVNLGSTLVYAFIGFEEQEIVVKNQTTINVVMNEQTESLDEIVITAMGIEKKPKALSYSTQKVAAEDLEKVKSPNLLDGLEGRSAGLSISKASGGAGSASKIVLRGNASINGSNEPLIVVDGVPFANSVTGGAVGSIWEGRNGNTAFSNINPDDIESVNVLKGSAAAALYGGSAANGAIIITTKKGKTGKTNVTINSSIVFEDVDKRFLPDLQNEYQQSVIGESLGSWGDKNLDGDYLNPYPFFQYGNTLINGVNLSTGNDKSQFYASYANTKSQGILEGNEQTKHNALIKASASAIDDKLNLNFSINVINQQVENNPSLGFYNNPIMSLYAFPRGDDFGKYIDFEKLNPDRFLQTQNWPYIQGNTGFSNQNPYWILNRNLTTDRSKKFLAQFEASYQLLDWLKIQGRVRYDQNSANYELRRFATSDNKIVHPTGRFDVNESQNSSIFGDLLFIINKDISDKITHSTILGTNAARGEGIGIGLGTQFSQGLYYHNVWDARNIKNPRVWDEDWEWAGYAAFFSSEIGYDDKLFLSLTGRMDRSSGLPDPYFYYSGGLTYLIHEDLKLPNFINFLKLRGSYSLVGNGISGLATVDEVPYGLDSFGRLEAPSVSNLGQKLKPERTESVEFGINTRFFSNKLDFDFTYYSQKSYDQLITVASPAGSFTINQFINGGEIENEGIEMSLGYKDSFTKNFKSHTILNYGANKNKVNELSDRLLNDRVVLNDFNGIYQNVVREGGEYGDIYGSAFERDENGAIVYDDNDMPVRSNEATYLGNPTPDFQLSLSQTFSYKNLDISFLIDGRFGGESISYTEAILDANGSTQKTAIDRNRGAVVFDGRFYEPQNFYESYAGYNPVSEMYLYDGTNITIRQFSIGYNIDNLLMFNQAKFSLVFRNMITLYNKAPHNTSATFSRGNSMQGIDVFGLPSTRTFGATITLGF